LISEGGGKVGGEVLDEDVLEEGVGNGETDGTSERTGEAVRRGSEISEKAKVGKERTKTHLRAPVATARSADGPET
jgi:hypothetical protein